MSNKSWTEAEIRRLIALISEHRLNSRGIGEVLSRSASAVRNKAYELKLEIYTKPEQKKMFSSGKKSAKEMDIESFKLALAALKPSVDWKIVKSTKHKKSGKGFKIHLIVADHHVPYHNDKAIKAHLNLIDDIAFDGFHILGDYMDMGPISHWNQTRAFTSESLRLRRDYMEGNVLLDEYDKRLSKGCKKSYYFGNHECWIYDLYEKVPTLAPSKDGKIPGYCHPTHELHLKERGYEVHEDPNEIGKIGRLSITHGMYANSNHTKTHIDRFKSNVLYAHVHTIRTRLESSPAKELAIQGESIGCNCNMNPDYMKNKAHMWSHGIAVVYEYPNGYFQVDNIRVLQNTFIFNGKVYSGK